MAEYCRNCAEKLFGEKVAAKHFRGLCKKGETYTELCEGCGDLVELDHNGWRIGTRRSLQDDAKESIWMRLFSVFKR